MYSKESGRQNAIFTIQVSSAFYLKNIDVVVIEGQVEGNLKNGVVLADKNNPNAKYITKGLGFVDGKNVKHSADRLDIQLEVGNYNVEELIGKTLMSIE